jgi:hypothetical protein
MACPEMVTNDSLILPEFDHPVGTFDIAQIPYIIEAGAQAARKQLSYLRRLLIER